jgi:phosphopantetheinyl transferase
MRCVLARYCGKNVPPSGLRFELGERGKPSLAGYVERETSDPLNVAPPPPLRFSLSHTNKLLALAVTSAPNAVDERSN